MSYRFFQNRTCEYFPCHKGAGEDFNCLFCFCPLYSQGESCGGHFILTADGFKDCTHCLYPHDPKNYDEICHRLSPKKDPP